MSPTEQGNRASVVAISCRYCGARSDMDPIEAFRRMVGCNNCRMDIAQRGRWTGCGWGIFEALLDKWGNAHVEVAEAKAREESGVNR